jgi:hypothetical protein
VFHNHVKHDQIYAATPGPINLDGAGTAGFLSNEFPERLLLILREKAKQ